MTDAPTPAPAPAARPNLDIGGILGSTFKIYGKNFPFFFGVVFVPYLAIQLFFSFGLGLAAMEADPVVLAEGGMMQYWILTVASVVVFLLGFLVIQAVVVRSAVSSKLDQGVQFSAAFSAGLKNLLPLIVLGIIAGIAIMIGWIFLIVPGLYIMAMFYVMVPAIVFENKGFAGLGRSIELTSGYRWSIVGVNIVLFFIALGASLVIGLLAGAFALAASLSGGNFFELATSPAYLLAMTLLDAIVNGAIYPISMIAAAMVFVRLREIKEGGDEQALLKIFE